MWTGSPRQLIDLGASRGSQSVGALQTDVQIDGGGELGGVLD